MHDVAATRSLLTVSVAREMHDPSLLLVLGTGRGNVAVHKRQSNREDM